MIVEKFPPTKLTIGSPVTALPFDAQIDVMMDWARARLSKVVCIANVHMLVETSVWGDPQASRPSYARWDAIGMDAQAVGCRQSKSGSGV